jgi:hypothetical protein
MGNLDQYGKDVLRAVAGDEFVYAGLCAEVRYGSERHVKIDGTVGGSIAVAIESRNCKEARGAVLD